MGRMGESKHLKRHVSPAFWPIHRKEKVWTVKPSPGPHPKDRCIPLAVILRDLLGLAKTAREAKLILAEGKVKVDGKVRRDGSFPVGLMDVVEIAGLNKAYRMVPHPKEFLTLLEVDGSEKNFKLCKILNKTTVKGGHIQLNLHDGRNLLVRVADPTKPEEDIYRTGDTIKLDYLRNEILAHYPFKVGAYAVVTGGKNVGVHGVIEAVEKPNPLVETLVKIKSSSGAEYNTISRYVMVVGEGKPEIRLPEV
ncbi:MAG: 30S ribosomal protein S4e [Candidatus Hecatellales archaeon]|nr:MAG: 30S ribosomal protein S4e [Candidatus Hecatellales archaeon]